VTTSTLGLTPTNTGTRIELRIVPRASRTAVDGVRAGRLLVRVTAPPVDGAANDAVVTLLASALDMPRSAVRIVAGQTHRNKTVEVTGLSVDDARRRLAGQI
jgi:uncharacterized protein (TIGR00251 family)